MSSNTKEIIPFLKTALDLLTEMQRKYNLDLDNEDCNEIFKNFTSFVAKLENSSVSEDEHLQNCLRLCLALLQEDVLKPTYYEKELSQFHGFEGGSFDALISPHLTRLFKALFLDGLLAALKIGASDRLKSTPEYQYLMHWAEIRNHLSEAANSTQNYEDPTLDAWRKLHLAMRSYQKAASDLKSGDCRKAYEAANSPLEEILSAQNVSGKVKEGAQPKSVAENRAKKLNAFKEGLATKRAAPTKLSSAFGMLVGAAMMVADVIVQAFAGMAAAVAVSAGIAPITVNSTLWEEGKALFNQSRKEFKEFDEAPSAASIKSTVAMERSFTDFSNATREFASKAISSEVSGCKAENELTEEEKAIARELVEIPLCFDNPGLPDEKRTALLNSAAHEKGALEMEFFFDGVAIPSRLPDSKKGQINPTSIPTPVATTAPDNFQEEPNDNLRIGKTNRTFKEEKAEFTEKELAKRLFGQAEKEAEDLAKEFMSTPVPHSKLSENPCGQFADHHCEKKMDNPNLSQEITVGFGKKG